MVSKIVLIWWETYCWYCHTLLHTPSDTHTLKAVLVIFSHLKHVRCIKEDTWAGMLIGDTFTHFFTHSSHMFNELSGYFAQFGLVFFSLAEVKAIIWARKLISEICTHLNMAVNFWLFAIWGSQLILWFQPGWLWCLNFGPRPKVRHFAGRLKS